jgi:hypothetical protein
MKTSGTQAGALTTLAFGAVLAFGAMALPHNPAVAASKNIHSKPPAGFVKVSDALKNPGMAFVPGLGTLYVDPKTLPAGPFLGYDKKSRLVNVTYMLPAAELEKNAAWPTLGTAVSGLKVDHTEVHVSGAHPGVMERHIHVINWLVSDSEKKQRVGEYPHLH